MNMKIIAKNRRAKFDYAIEDTLLVGMVLKGHEVKSIRAGHISLNGSFVTIQDNQLWLKNAHISPYQPANTPDYVADADRKLLANKPEVARLQAAKQSGQHVVPIAVGLKGRLIKLELGIGRSQKRTDKRDKIKTKDTNIDIERDIKQRQKI